MSRRQLSIALLCGALAGCGGNLRSAPQRLDDIAYTEFVPQAGQGPVVIVLSGAGGSDKVVFVGDGLVERGYYVILCDGRYFPASSHGRDNLRKMILLGQNSLHARPGKVAVIGLSQGGASVLTLASTMPDVVSVGVAWYPATTSIADKDRLVEQWKVPVVAFAGEADLGPNGNHCCVIDTIRAMAARAKDVGAAFELYAYPGARHDFNHPGLAEYDKAAAEDSWRRMLAALQQYLGT